MEQTENATIIDSSSTTNINGKPSTSDDINDLTAQLERSANRAELIQSTEKGSTSAKNPVYVEWYGINYSISTEHKESWSNKFENSGSKLGSGKNLRTIIENVHGCANPGEVLAIMGPSGCGKTTLLNLLGDRVGSKGVQGTLTLNGHKPTKISKKFIAYCTQDDMFFPQLTVKETLSFTARLRLPREMSRHDKLKQVENTMTLLNLTKCANTTVGDQRTRGISGGERKRTNIASELLTNPSVILLDEPTTGLDSTLALELAKILKEFAVKQKKTIIMVIHQPSTQVFDSFDKLMLMADGQMVYFGERADVVDYLADQGFKCHPNFNPSDYIMELLNDNTIKQKLINAYAHKVRDDPTGKQVIEKHSRRSHTDNQLDNIILNAPVTTGRRWEATFLQQISVLTERTFKQSRKVILSRINVYYIIALTVISLIVWFRIPFAESNINDRIGNIYFNSLFWSFYPMIGAISTFPLDLIMLSKERQSRSYRLLSYYLSKQIAELPLVILSPMVYSIPVYWVSNLLPDFGRFVAYLVVILIGTLTSQSFGYFFGATLSNVQKSMAICVVFLFAFILLSGYFVKHLPTGITWMKYLSFMKYFYSLLMQTQFDSSKAQFKCAGPGTLPTGQKSVCDTGNMTSISGISILDGEGLNDLPWYINLIVLSGFCIVLRILAYYSLRKNSSRSKK
ncbi:hypothetical protein RclHR1_06770008 [Rhizophagus clarus]|uniref:ABC transporter G family member 9-like n=1 Tax=Rhizophagus clarus TaxID=94130 RepID=A0A2Z6S6C6_9GLOM|nr:hypothetical protein RclHR1_06770008 [Rhizophagus clarus]GES88074.1 ABC transporter G family member 9-like [Rhizophagus clarus]